MFNCFIRTSYRIYSFRKLVHKRLVMTQTERIIKHLKEHGSITPLEAIKEYGITRLGARIWDLRDLGYDIETQTETSKNRFGDKTSYAKYVLKGGVKNESVSRH